MLDKYIKKYFQRTRIYCFKILSNNKNIQGVATKNQPVLFLGEGNIIFGRNVSLGYFPSPKFYSDSIHIEARRLDSEIKFGNNIYINNGFIAVAESSYIHIEDDVLIGTNVEIINSDFHGLDPKERNSGKQISLPIIISKNVFIGSNVVITKGVTIGENTVIANGSVVTTSFPENVIVGGNPAKVIRSLLKDE